MPGRRLADRIAEGPGRRVLALDGDEGFGLLDAWLRRGLDPVRRGAHDCVRPPDVSP